MGASIIAGEVYRGNQFPGDQYYGVLFYGDFVRGWIRYLTFDLSDTLVTGDFAFEPDAGMMIHIGLSPDGSLYYCTGAGEVRRIRYAGGNQAPIITSVLASPTEGPAPLDVTFTATATDTDLPANGLTYSLSGEPAGAVIDPVTGVFTWTPTEAQGPGAYTFDVVVTDDGTPNLADSETITVTVGEVNVAPVLGIGRASCGERE